MRLIDPKQAYEIARLNYSDFALSLADLTSLREVLEDCDTIDAVELPLKIGEKCYCINHKNEVIEDIVDDYDIWSIKDGVKLRITLKNYNDYVIGEFGKGVFRTREEAEKARESKWKDD